MGDAIAVENYKKRVVRYFDDWSSEAASVAKALAPITAEIAKLEADKTPGPDDKKRLAELKAKCSALHKRMDAASESLRVNLMLNESLPEADEKELVKLPGWLKEIIKAKGIPLGKGVSIAPKVDFDFKSKKLKSFGITIKW
jgi:hypothetical protein